MLEELPRDVGVVPREPAEVPEGDHVAAQARDGGHRGGARRLADQCELAEVVAGTDPSDLLAVDAHRRLALGDDEEADAAHRALLDDRHTGSELTFLCQAGELTQLTLAEPREEPDPTELVDDRHRGDHIAVALPASTLTAAPFPAQRLGDHRSAAERILGVTE